MRILVAAFGLAIFSFSALAQTITGGTSADVAVLFARKQAVIEAYNKADIAALAANYTEDAWHISPRRAPAVGREAIAAYFAPAMKSYTMQSNPRVLNVDIAGDTATMISANELKGQPRLGAVARDGQAPPAFSEQRTNLTVFKKQADGRWLIHRFVDTTPPEAAR
ncbi:MAG: DUF4440 domain-containing protein [Rhodospirillaceae bacterium]|nr:DUF4440 domain-containing protein [Rhodospirillaceae bacterium]